MMKDIERFSIRRGLCSYGSLGRYQIDERIIGKDSYRSPPRFEAEETEEKEAKITEE